MKSLRVGVGVVGVAVALYAGLGIGAAMKGVSVMELGGLGSGVVAAKTSRHTTAGRVAAIEAKKPQLKSVAKSAGGKLRILVFYFANAVGIKNVSVIIAPYDMRNGRKPELEGSVLSWYPELCNQLEEALK